LARPRLLRTNELSVAGGGQLLLLLLFEFGSKNSEMLLTDSFGLPLLADHSLFHSLATAVVRHNL